MRLELYTKCKKSYTMIVMIGDVNSVVIFINLDKVKK